MSITRRTFAIGASTAVGLTILGCGEDEPQVQRAPNRPAAKLATEPFHVGSKADYQQPGVYDNHAQTQGVYLVSDGSTLVALSAACTHNECSTAWKPDDQQFECPCHQSTFEPDGTNLPEGRANRPLDRLAIVADAQGQITVDPTQKYDTVQGNRDDAAARLSLI